ncbi:MAG: thiamine-phosphate kinase [Oscillatoriales cyanobacterium C42_A2020_001]|nr:thiamine-phosphate kinase [Leptolyngbyaceae cyanobacterium C42_A2020_001]
MKVRKMGEQALLQRLQAFCPAEVIGDDAAILAPQPGMALVVTTDVLVDGVHFSDRTTAPEDAGWRAAAANLSDLAAMGANPIGLTVGLGLSGEVTVEWVERLYHGLVECLQTYNTVIVGGDVVRSPVTTIAITALGEAPPQRLIRRSHAKPDQAILATGWHGASRAGLELLLHPETSHHPLTPTEQAFFVQAHQRPIPRLDVLPLLWRGEATLIAGMDSSDGLADAVLQICRASGVGAELERSQLPIPPGLVNWVGEKVAIEWTLYGGEDFELVLCLPFDLAEKLAGQLGKGAAIVGKTTVEPDIWLLDANGIVPRDRLTLEQSFQHFS